MKNRQYAIVDIETTGGKPGRDKITEIIKAQRLKGLWNQK